MSRLLLVRHGQAIGAFQGDYGALTQRGQQQANRLGEHWARTRFRPDAVFIGPQQRHRETAACIGRAMADSWHTPTLLPELDEHAGVEVFAKGLEQVASEQSPLGDLARAVQSGAIRSGNQPLRLFMGMMKRWVEGELVVPDVESWTAFRERTRRGLEILLQQPERSRTVVAVTSAGTIGGMLGALLGTDDAATLELALASYNTSICEIRFTTGRQSLSRYNYTPHLSTAEDHTLI